MVILWFSEYIFSYDSSLSNDIVLPVLCRKPIIFFHFLPLVLHAAVLVHFTSTYFIRHTMYFEYFYFRWLSSKEIKIKNACHIYPHFPLSHVFNFYVASDSFCLNVSSCACLLVTNSLRFCLEKKNLHFTVLFRSYFHWTQNSDLTDFFLLVIQW